MPSAKSDSGSIGDQAKDSNTKYAEEIGAGEVSTHVQPGTLSLEEDAAGGLGRHLGVFSTTFLVIGRIIGTGIFSTPSSILSSVGSLGASLMLWTFGTVLSFCGLAVWLELGTIFPRSGGEKVYLEAIYKKPKLLATVLFATNAILLGFTAQGCLVFASNILTAAHVTVTTWNQRGIGIAVITFVTLVHGFTPHWGVRLMNFLGVFKVVILLLIVVSGWVVLGGHVKSVPDPHANFRDAFANSSHAPYNYASALFKVINSFAGWSNAAYVMNEVRDPVRTIKIAAPLGLGICSILYIFANISYFAAVQIPALKKSGVTVASYYFLVVFGEKAQRALSVFVALSALGNVLTVTFAQSRVNQELGKEGILPFTKFWASNWPFGAPLPGLIVHLIPSVIIILGPPAKVAYPFILDVEGYPGQIINLFVVLGLIYLRFKHPEIYRPFRAWWPAIAFFLLSAVFLLVIPFIRPPGGIGDTPPLPYWLYPIVGIAVFGFGFAYWLIWRIALPRLGKYKLEPVKVTLDDRTVVTQVGSFSSLRPI
ncbi:amino acid transporter [Meredithblackwellia eburnea MCA 4105]